MDATRLGLHVETWLDEAPPGAPRVVLVHGLGVSHRYFRPLAACLAPRARVYAPDLPGFGRSPGPARALDVAGLADALARALEARGIGAATCVGNSLGCQVVAELAAREPARVSRAVLVGPTVDPSGASAAAQLLRLVRDVPLEPPALIPVVAADYLACGPSRLWATFRHALGHRMTDALARVQAPTLVVRGSRDPLVSRAWAEAAVRLVPAGRLVEVPGTAHAAHFAAPRRLARLICAFVGGGLRGRSRIP